MATTKKTHPTKKSKIAVSAKKRAKAAPVTWRFYVVSIGIFLVAVATVIVIGILASNYVGNKMLQTRLDRIEGIYSSLKLDVASYQVEYKDVFADKRVYEWDSGRTHSSEIIYSHGDTVSNTLAELDAKIKSSGFMFVDEPYPGSVFTQYHYKSSEGEYVRLTVVSKPYWDAIRNAALMGAEIPESAFALDKNAGPARVTIKVNLDDNNE